MHFSTIAVVLAGATAAVATAIPALKERQSTLCTGSYSPVCCATDVLGLADLDCAPRKSLVPQRYAMLQCAMYSRTH